MREIKYQAWNKENNRMAQVYAIDWDDTRIVSLHIIYLDTRISAKLYPHEEFGDQIELREYTGLKDKNGKEIYEGDVLKWTSWKLGSKSIDGSVHEANDVNEVYWNKGAWRLKGNETWVLAIYDNIEIIGNIWENPELLKSEL